MKKRPSNDEVLLQVAAKLAKANMLLAAVNPQSSEVKLFGEEIRDVMTRVRQAADTTAA